MKPTTPPPLLPLAALMLAGSLGAAQALAQDSTEKTLKTVTVKDTAESPTAAKDNLLVKKTGIAKGNQQLKDIPQTVTVMTEKLMDDRNLDDLREVLKTTSGVTFLAGETGEEDVRIRGFSLQQAGDIYVDGLRDAPLVERDTFNMDRVEVLKGSASMLFGKGSTGGVVNQVNKQPFLMEQNEVNVTAGSGEMYRLTGDFNKPLGENAAMRINAMVHKAENWGAKVDKKRVAGSYRWGIGERDEYTVGLYHLETDGRPLYAHPWMVSNGGLTNNGPRNSGANTTGTLVPVLDARNYYGMASDHLRTETTHLTLSHKHRFDADSELKTTVRAGQYARDLLGSQVGFKSLTQLANLGADTLLSRTPKARYGDSDILQLQSDYNKEFEALGRRHSLIAGVDVVDENAERNNNHTTGLSNPDIRVGSPNNGVGIADPRTKAPSLFFQSRTLGVYAQDTVKLTDTFKLLGGLRLEHFGVRYKDAQGYEVEKSATLLSPRVGALWQPDAHTTYYTSLGTSYNTSGDTYAYGVGTSLSPTVVNNQGQTVANTNLTTLNTPPEKSRNLEFGGKFELFDGKGLLGVALFHSQKYNERNTDVDSATNQYLLSGKRHATGMEFNFAGRLSPLWDMFYNHTWIPDAKIDTSSATGNMQQGDRPGLTPKHSASLWSTYRVAPQWRVGAGLNHRSAQSPLTNAHIRTQAFTTVDAMVEHTLSDSTLLKLNVSNLGNKRYIDQVYTSFYVPGTPRRVELSLKTLF